MNRKMEITSEQKESKVSKREQKDFTYAKVYKIVNDVDDEVYVGHTCKQYLSQRFANHKYKYNSNNEIARTSCKSFYDHIRKIGFGHFSIELIETVKCSTIDELKAREGHWIREIGTLNKCITGRTSQEYRIDNKSILNEKARIKTSEYRKLNHEKAKACQRKHYNENKNKILEKRKEQFVCGCGLSLLKINKACHERSNKHQTWLKSIN